MRKRRRPPAKPTPPAQRINERIRVPQVRLIDEKGEQVGVIDTTEALAMARQREVDLVEVAPQARPPVARLMDYGQFKYEQSKKEREAKKQQQKSELREVRMKAKIDDHDIDFKTRTAEKLLLRGDKVKVSVMFRGREITHPQIGAKLLERVMESLDPIATVEKTPALEGRMMTTILVPDKRKIAAQQRERARGDSDTDPGDLPGPEEQPEDPPVAGLQSTPEAVETDAPEAGKPAETEDSTGTGGGVTSETASEDDESEPGASEEAAPKATVPDTD